eukprot:7381682-Prymnesium_polylepis.1
MAVGEPCAGACCAGFGPGRALVVPGGRPGLGGGLGGAVKKEEMDLVKPSASSFFVDSGGNGLPMHGGAKRWPAASDGVSTG